MIIDEIEKLKSDITAVQNAFEYVYVHYIRYFPELAEELRLLKLQAMVTKHAPSEEQEDDQALEQLPEAEVPYGVESSDCKELSVIEQDELEPEPEDTELDEEEEKQYKKLLRKCLNMCHPDKTSRFPSTIRLRLNDIFHELQEIQHNRYYSQLVSYYVTIRLLRGEEAHVQDHADLLNEELNQLKAEYFHLLQNKLSNVIVHHKQGQLFTARSTFEDYLHLEIQSLKREIQGA